MLTTSLSLRANVSRFHLLAGRVRSSTRVCARPAICVRLGVPSASSRTWKPTNGRLSLTKALESRGFDYLLPFSSPNRKIDHSSVTPYDLRLSDRELRTGLGPQEEDTIGLQSHGSRSLPGLSLNGEEAHYNEASTASNTKSLQGILAGFVSEHFDGDFQSSLEKNPAQVSMDSARFFDKQSQLYLVERGYDHRDVILWLWIITAKEASVAAERLDKVAHSLVEEGKSSMLPVFVLMFLLRRSHINAASLKLIWSLSLELLGQRVTNELSSPPQSEKTYASVKHKAIGNRTFNLMMIRFLRHARLVWAELLPSVAATVASHWLDVHRRGAVVDVAKLNFFFNKILALLAIPSSRFHRNFLYHQKAMHCIVSAMTEFEPHLLLSREGHRAIIRLQLAHRKTDSEVEWARSKALSWPPWRTAKLGIEEDVGLDQGISRAGSAISLLQSAGYESREWDDVAKVYAGWDTDNSPTIQTRTTITAPPTLQEKSGTPEALWASRIRATRTAEEAWKIFLDCRDTRACPMGKPYAEMLQKLALRDLGQEPPHNGQVDSAFQSQPDETKSAMPGDNLELTIPPQDPRMRPYLRVALPDLEEFLNQALTDGFKPAGRLLAFLLNRKPSYDLGRKILEQSALPPEVVRVLISPVEPTPDFFRQIDDRVRAAAVNWLVSQRSQWDTDLVKVVRYSSWHDFHNPPNIRTSYRLVLHAFRLVCMSKSKYAPAWNTLFEALSTNLTSPVDRPRCRTIVEMWALHSRLVEELQQVDRGAQYFFPSMCEVFAEALASQIWLQERNKGFLLDLLDTKELKTAFERWTGTTMQTRHPFSELRCRLRDKRQGSRETMAKTNLMPQLLVVPDATQLHWFARALAVAFDYEGIAALVLWMQRHQGSLRDRIPRGSTQPCFFAMRAGMEIARQQHGSGKVTDECLALVRDAIVDMEGDEAWPSDVAVSDYVAKPKSRRLRLDLLRVAGAELRPSLRDTDKDNVSGGDAAAYNPAVRKVVPRQFSDPRWS